MHWRHVLFITNRERNYFCCDSDDMMKSEEAFRCEVILLFTEPRTWTELLIWSSSTIMIGIHRVDACEDIDVCEGGGNSCE